MRLGRPRPWRNRHWRGQKLAVKITCSRNTTLQCIQISVYLNTHRLDPSKLLIKRPLQSPSSGCGVTEGLTAAHATRRITWSVLDGISGAWARPIVTQPSFQTWEERGWGAILSQSCNALIDSPYLLRRLGSTSQIRYAFNRGQVLQTTQSDQNGKITEKMTAAGTKPL